MPFNLFASASPSDPTAVQVDDLLIRLNERDRAAVNKHLASCDAESDPAHAALWRRLAGLLASLATASPRRRGGHAVEFFIPDGPYRKQVFALEDHRNGSLVLYLPDVLDEALAAYLLTVVDDALSYPGFPGGPADLTLLTAANSPDAPEHVEHMLGWNRKAMRLVLPIAPFNPDELRAAEALCHLAAKHWI